MKINGVDVWKVYGAFLTEKKAGEWTNYEELLRGSQCKEQAEVDFAERDGVELPASLDVRLQPRDVTLFFCLWAQDAASYFSRYDTFMRMLREGDGGWLRFSLKEIGRVFTFYYKGMADMEQLTPLDGGVCNRFHLVFREPNPVY